MKKLVILIAIFAFLGNCLAAEIVSTKKNETTYISVVKVSDDQYQFKSCSDQCQPIGDQDSYSTKEVLKAARKLKTRSTLVLTGESIVIAGVTAVSVLAIAGGGIAALVATALEMSATDIATTLAITSAGLAAPPATLLTVKNIQFLNPNYPNRLGEALFAIVLNGEQSVSIKVKHMDYIVKILNKMLTKVAK